MNATSALLVIDVQNCFIPGGTQAVPQGDEVVPIINVLAGQFANVILTQDWHPAAHTSFASSHPGKAPFETTTLPYGEQVLWPDHAIQGSRDAEFHPDLNIPHAQLILRKGYHPGIDSYSAFQEADRSTNTGLAAYLRARGITTLYLAGLATDFCVLWSALDACAAGFDTIVMADACWGIDLEGSLAAAWLSMEAAGVRRMTLDDLLQDAT
ncbi:bifunctional nicotinamidase/pyrazinamidase [Pokkaliibacter sp. CJK22405]|uniref:bifunctional nicotinamidase/pyrazinamidase n=1 Tax=Pokkaliibacter sp. CJK22405 TaxID=3384615 RepID=UPI0039850E8D